MGLVLVVVLVGVVVVVLVLVLVLLLVLVLELVLVLALVAVAEPTHALAHLFLLIQVMRRAVKDEQAAADVEQLRGPA